MLFPLGEIMISVELSHLLSGEKFNESHLKSLKIFKDNIKSNQDKYTICVMVDNYNFPNQTNDIEGMIKCYNQENMKIDNLCYENVMVLKALEVIEKIPDIIDTSSNLGINSCDGFISLLNKETNKYSCCLLTSIWYLARMGEVNLGMEPAQKLINVLPKKYQSNEKKVREILLKINPSLVDNIIWYFY